MSPCPHCRQPGVSAGRKWLSSPAFPASCRHCGGLSYLATSRASDILLSFTLWLLACGLCAALLNSGWPLYLGLLVGLAVYARYWQRTALTPTDAASTAQTQARHAVLNALAVLLTALWS